MNDAICLVMAPLVLELTIGLGRNPVPYLLAVAMASNVGSTATITGNPQNMMIGSFSEIPYTRFAFALAPVALIGLIADGCAAGPACTATSSPAVTPAAAAASPARQSRPGGTFPVATRDRVALFFAGQPPAKAAIVVGALLLLTRRVKSARVYAEIDWSLLLMFAGLFIIVAGAERELLTPTNRRRVGRLHLATFRCSAS